MSFKMNIPEEMRSKYIERRRRDIEELRKASAGGDFEPFQRIGHQLKGNGATYGYDELGELGQRMEEAGTQKDSVEINACLAEFTRWISEHNK